MHKQVYGTTIVVACIQACLDDDKMDTESPTLPMTVIHALFSLAAKQAWDVQLINADTAFLNAAPNETIYVSLLQGLSEPGIDAHAVPVAISEEIFPSRFAMS